MTRKVGEEYWGDWYWDEHSTSGDEMRLKYRVVEIVKVKRYGNYGDEVKAESIEAIEREHRPHLFTYRAIK